MFSSGIRLCMHNITLMYISGTPGHFHTVQGHDRAQLICKYNAQNKMLSSHWLTENWIDCQLTRTGGGVFYYVLHTGILTERDHIRVER